MLSCRFLSGGFPFPGPRRPQPEQRRRAPLLSSALRSWGCTGLCVSPPKPGSLGRRQGRRQGRAEPRGNRGGTGCERVVPTHWPWGQIWGRAGGGKKAGRCGTKAPPPPRRGTLLIPPVSELGRGTGRATGMGQQLGGTGTVPGRCQGDKVGGPPRPPAPESVLLQHEDFVNTGKYKP